MLVLLATLRKLAFLGEFGDNWHHWHHCQNRHFRKDWYRLITHTETLNPPLRYLKNTEPISMFVKVVYATKFSKCHCHCKLSLLMSRYFVVVISRERKEKHYFVKK